MESSSRANTEIGSWIIERKLSEGGMGEVYLARHKHLGTAAALKILSEALTQDSNFRERFFQEAKTQARLQHPHIAQVLDFIEQDGRFCEVMEYLPGGTLADALSERGSLPFRLALIWMKQILLALEHAHSAGIVHRDIKPSNIMLNQKGDAKLMDFGIAMVVGTKRLTITGRVIGTPEYMSPEQITKPKEIDARSDIYSMGIVLFELLTGHVPFSGDTDFVIYQAHVNDQIPSLRAFNPNIPAGIEEILLKALQKNPNDRYQSCKEFLLAIERYEQETGLQEPSEVPPTRLGAWRESDQQVSSEPIDLSLTSQPLGLRTPVSQSVEEAHHSFPSTAGRRFGLWKVLGMIAVIALLAASIIIYFSSRQSPSGDSNDPPKAQSSTPVFQERLLATIPQEEIKLDDIFPMFSNTGNKVAYEVKLNNKRIVIINGIRGPVFDSTSLPEISPDGNQVAYYGSQEQKVFLMINDRKIAETDLPSDLYNSCFTILNSLSC